MKIRNVLPTLSLCVSAFTIACGLRAATIPLSTLDLSKSTSGWGTTAANKGIAGRPITIKGTSYTSGVGTHANSKMRIDLSGNALRFTAKVGLDDSSEGKGKIEFIVKGDGKVLWKSGVMSGSNAAESVDVALNNVRTLELSVTDGGDGESYDHADWAEAMITVKDGAPGPVMLPPFEEILVKTAGLTLEFRVGEDRRLNQQIIGAPQGKSKPQRTDESYPQAGDGYVWEPALQITHVDGNTSTALLFDSVTKSNVAPDIELTRISLRDPEYPLQVVLCFRTYQKSDVLEQWIEVRHEEDGEILLQRMASSSLLFSPTNAWLTHFFGDWANEMQPISEPIGVGMKVLDSKLGVRAHQFRNPSFILSMDGEPKENSGRMLAGSLAWSGSFQCAFEHIGHSVRALSGINPFASAYHLKRGETFTTPAMIWVWSSNGLGQMSRNFHSWARKFALRDGDKPRTVLLNNWEATGFDFDFDRIAGLFEPAKQIGTELFLLDDGWFANKYPRLDDKAGLGDWEPNRNRLPQGLAPLAAEANKQGVQFGIWIEPEMVNPKSELFEQHPDWVIRQPKRELELQRNQLVLDLTRPAVQDYEWNVIKTILSVPGISYAKWDCNRYLTQPGSPFLPPDRQSHLWIDYTKALYELMDKTAATFPDTELMLCSGGGGRVDYGALKYFHEFWPSDNTDPVRRVTMQWDYSYFFPSMSMAGHVTHWGKRPMHFACAVAMSVRFGMDLDLKKLSTEDREICARSIASYKSIREVTHLGELYRLERPHDAARGALNYVSKEKDRAVLFVFQLRDGEPKPVRPQGLDPKRNYVVTELNPAPGRRSIATEGKVATGETLMRDGVAPSCEKAIEACIIELRGQ